MLGAATFSRTLRPLLLRTQKSAGFCRIGQNMSLNAPPAARKYVLPMSAFPARPALARRLAPAAVHVHPAARVKSAKGRVPDAHNAGDGYGPAVCCRKASLRSPRVSCWTDSTVLCPCRESTMSLCQSLTGHCMLCQSLTAHCMLCSCCCCKVSPPPPPPPSPVPK